MSTVNGHGASGVPCWLLRTNSAYIQTAIDLSDKMKCDVPAFSGNKSNQEKHILTTLAEEENFENYIEYIQKPKEYCSRFIKKKVDESNISSKGKRVMDAVNEATEEVKRNNGDANMWLQHLSRKLQDELQLQEKSCPEQSEVSGFDFLREIVIAGLTSIKLEINNSFQDISDLKWEMFRKKPEDILIEQLCRCCWAQCPFCNAICTNTLENHSGDHNVRFHRNPGINGWSFNKVHFCANGKVFSFKDYRKAGGEYAKWNITPDNSEMPYWKWFVCRFQEDLEKYYKKKIITNREIPKEWWDYTKEQAIESLNEL
uniref:Interferon-induced very large GTPase 1 n=1 Tax=Astyanax mexicanus TaxID=7994 RepID=A0A3B1JPE5_ASTMX